MSDKKAVEVKRIVIKIGDKEVSLSLDEAKELKNILKEMFNDGGTTIISTPYVVPWYPWTYPHTYWGVTYSADNCTVYCASNA